MSTARHKQKGFTLVEALVYVAVLVVVSVGAVTLLLSLNNLFQLYKTQKILFDSSIIATERLITEIRNAEEVDGSSVFADEDGVLSLINNSVQYTFSLVGDDLVVDRNSTLEGSLVQNQVSVDHFYVYRYTGTETELIRVRMRLTASTSASVASQEIDVAAVVRESYAP